MTSIHDLKLGSNTLEVLEVILKSLEAFPDEIAKLDLSKFTKIASDIDILAQNVIQVQNNISDMKTAIQNSKTDFDTNKANFDTKYRQFGQDLVTAEAIKQTILDTQNAINMVKNEVDEAKTYLDTFNAKYDKFSKEYKTIMALSANIDSIENLLNDLRDVLDNGVIDDNNVSTQKTYSSKKISDDAQALKTELNNRADELSQSLNQVLETKLSKAEYEADKPTFATKDELVLKANQTTTYTKTEVDDLVNVKADKTYVNSSIRNVNIPFLPTIKVFDTAGSHTWTKPEGVKTIKVYVTGGGGSGANNANDAHKTAGGGAGGTAIKIIDVTNVSQVSLTVGRGGSSSSSFTYANGNSGGASSFGSYCSATGGYGGFRSDVPILGGRGGAGGKGIGGDLNLTGGAGQSGLWSGVNTDCSGGSGGNSFWGGGGGYTGESSYATNGVHGGGGVGAMGYGSQSHNSSGGDGIIVIEEYR